VPVDEHYGAEEGQDGNADAEDDARVPIQDISCPFGDEVDAYVRDRINPLTDDGNGGMDLYGQVVDFLVALP
jgi:hypothetical protein